MPVPGPGEIEVSGKLRWKEVGGTETIFCHEIPDSNKLMFVTYLEGSELKKILI